MMTEPIIIFSKEYDGETSYDLSRDTWEAIDPAYNDMVKAIPQVDGFLQGTFKVIIEWVPE